MENSIVYSSSFSHVEISLDLTSYVYTLPAVSLICQEINKVLHQHPILKVTSLRYACRITSIGDEEIPSVKAFSDNFQSNNLTSLYIYRPSTVTIKLLKNLFVNCILNLESLEIEEITGDASLKFIADTIRELWEQNDFDTYMKISKETKKLQKILSLKFLRLTEIWWIERELNFILSNSPLLVHLSLEKIFRANYQNFKLVSFDYKEKIETVFRTMSSLENLETLDLRKSEIRLEHFVIFFKNSPALKNLKKLFFGKCQIHPNKIHYLKYFENLEELDISEAYLEKNEEDFLDELGEIDTISMEDFDEKLKVSEILAILSGFQRLKSLSFGFGISFEEIIHILKNFKLRKFKVDIMKDDEKINEDKLDTLFGLFLNESKSFDKYEFIEFEIPVYCVELGKKYMREISSYFKEKMNDEKFRGEIRGFETPYYIEKPEKNYIMKIFK